MERKKKKEDESVRAMASRHFITRFYRISNEAMRSTDMMGRRARAAARSPPWKIRSLLTHHFAGCLA